MSASSRTEKTEKLLSQYVDLCNRIIAENKDAFWYRMSKRANEALWGQTYVRTAIYSTDPDESVAEFMLHYDPDAELLSLVSPSDYPDEQEVAFTWKTSLPYLRDVVLERPEWYVDHPLMLDWKWMKEFTSDQIVRHVDGRSLLTGVALGAAGMLAAVALTRGRRA